jgi:predicted aspartyl protease
VPETLRLFLIGIIFAIALCKGIQFLFVSILLPASAMILRWMYRTMRPSRRTSTNQNQLFPPRAEASQKTKRGLRGFANGHSTAGIADTGAAQNVVSLTFVQSLGLEIKPSTHKFRLGSSKQIMSLGNSFLQPIAPPKPH